MMLKKDMLRLLASMGLRDEYRQMKAEFGLAGFEPTGLDDNFGELIVILNNGLAPIRTEAAVMTYSSEVQDLVRVAFPVYRTEPAPGKSSRLTVADKRIDLETVENIDGLARHALDQQMPLIMTRAIARAVVKYQSQKSANEQHALAGFLLTVTNLATERADTRSWTTLPKEIQMTRVILPAGEQDVSIEILNAAGRPIDVIKASVEIQPRRRTFLTRHWIAPVPVQKQIVNSRQDNAYAQ
jgi:hypothetical protein